jgi:hypothetical protein
MAKWNLPSLPSIEPRMKLFLITRTERAPSYDVVRSMVVRAEDEDQARQEAAMKSMDEGAIVWLQPSMSHCEEISTDGEAQVLCVDAVNG